MKTNAFSVIMYLYKHLYLLCIWIDEEYQSICHVMTIKHVSLFVVVVFDFVSKFSVSVLLHYTRTNRKLSLDMLKLGKEIPFLCGNLNFFSQLVLIGHFFLV